MKKYGEKGEKLKSLMVNIRENEINVGGYLHVPVREESSIARP